MFPHLAVAAVAISILAAIRRVDVRKLLVSFVGIVGWAIGQPSTINRQKMLT